MSTAAAGDALRELCRRDAIEITIDGSDWEDVLRLASIHAVTPTVATAIRSGAVEAPASVAERLEDRRRAIAAANLGHVERLVALARAFERAGLLMVPVKGPVLASTAYGDIAMREFVDLDILVRPSDVASAMTILHPDRVMEPAVPHAVLELHVRNDHELTFRDGVGEIELQWQVVPRFFAADIDIDGMVSRSIPVDVAGADLRTLATEDLVLMLSVHASKHLWERFAWVVDLDRVVSRSRSVDWNVVGARAAAAGVLRMVRLGTAVVDRGLAPEWVVSAQASLGTEPAVDAAADRLAAAWFAPDERAARIHADPNFQPELFDLHDRPSDRLRHAWRWLVTPTDEDLTTVTLPRWAWSAYPVVRVMRLAGRALRR